MSYSAVDIKAQRIAHGWTQKQLADMTGASTQTVSNWETGVTKPSEANMGKLVELFTNGGQPDRVAALQEQVSRLRDDVDALKSVALRQARDFEEFRARVLELAAIVVDPEGGRVPQSETQAGP